MGTSFARFRIEGASNFRVEGSSIRALTVTLEERRYLELSEGL
jgi:hypothetical protein